MRTHLVSSGVVRDPRVAGSLPPCWRSPRKGVPAPGDGPGVEQGDPTVGLFVGVGVPEAPHDASWLRTDTVDIVIRSTTAPGAVALDDAIRYQLVDRRDWSMGGLLVVETQLTRPLSQVGADEVCFDWTCSYTVQYRTSVASGGA
jgi:hypothetical protein